MKDIKLIQDYSNRSCSTCNLGTNKGKCDIDKQNQCASFNGDETQKDWWISRLDDESDSEIYREITNLEIKQKVDNCYQKIRYYNEHLNYLRSICNHPSTSKVNYSYRIGCENPADICDICGEIIKVYWDE